MGPPPACAGTAEAEGAAAPPVLRRPRVERDFPVVTVTIGGEAGSGKNTVAHLIRGELAHHGIAAEGPDGLRTVLLRDAIGGLVRRGLKVVLVRADGGGA